MKIENIAPMDIEKRSFEILTEILGDKPINPHHEAVIKRCIHTSADFDYADNLYFTDNVEDIIAQAVKNGACIVTDTQMVKAGINKKLLAKFGGEVHCFIADEDVAKEASQRGVTRSLVSMERAAQLEKPIIFAIGNAPTALFSIIDLVKNNKLSPVAVIACPVGFVNVVESKEDIMKLDIPLIVARGRKGGSNIAAAVCNAILYSKLA